MTDSYCHVNETSHNLSQIGYKTAKLFFLIFQFIRPKLSKGDMIYRPKTTKIIFGLNYRVLNFRSAFTYNETSRVLVSDDAVFRILDS